MATLAFSPLAEIPNASNNTFSVAVSPAGRYVAVGTGVSPNYYGFASISTNGSTWTTTNITSTPVILRSVVFDSVSNYFVAVGSYVLGGNCMFMRSTDGVSWSTPASMGTPTIASMTSVAVNSAGVFMAVGDSLYSTSTDGINWTTPAIIVTRSSVNCVTVNNSTGIFVAVGVYSINNTIVGFSVIYTNGSWSTPAVISGFTSYSQLYSITVNSAGRYVAVGGGNLGIFITSTDGSTWTEPSPFNSLPISAGTMYSVTVDSSGRFVAVGNNYVNGDSRVDVDSRAVVVTSIDGLTWTSQILIDSGAIFFSIVTYGGNFLTVGGRSTSGIFSTWTLNSPTVPCFKEGSKILCQVDGNEVYLPIEQMTPGTLVKTSMDGYKEVKLIGKRPVLNPGHDERSQTRLYKCSPSNYPELNEDLYITGCHSILVKSLTDIQKEGVIKNLKRVFVTDKKYRLIACVDERAEPWNSEGTYNVWHFALENESNVTNYGVYANGLLVESASIRCMVERSKMEFQ